MGRGLGIFRARPKTHFVPGEAMTWDKRLFCPGSWLHPGQKGPPYICPLTSAFLQHLGIPDLRRAAVVSHRASCSAAVPERRPRSAASTPRPPWTMTPPGRSPVRRRPRPRATSSSPPRPPVLRARPRFAASGGLHCTLPRRHPLRCAPPRRQLPASSSRAAALVFPALCE